MRTEDDIAGVACQAGIFPQKNEMFETPFNGSREYSHRILIYEKKFELMVIEKFCSRKGWLFGN